MTDFPTEKARVLSEINNLQTQVSESQLMRRVNDAANELRGLPQRLQTIRQNGYRFASDLEATITGLAQRWPQIEMDARDIVMNRARKLGWDMDSLRDLSNSLNNAEGNAAEVAVGRVQSEISRIQNEIRQVEQQIETTLSAITQQFSPLTERLSHIESTIQHAQSASFPIPSGESLYLAVKAGWKKAEKETVDGVLFLTDQRVIMEENQKKGGFMGIGGNKIQQLAWEAPINAIQGVTSEKKGLLGNIDLVHLRFGSGGPAPETTVEVKEGVRADWFAQQVQRTVNGDIAQERAGS